MSTWREEKRKDRIADREQDREDWKAQREEARKDRREKEKARERRRERRRQTWAALTAWVAQHVGQIPWLIIMGAPMVLAWTSMARYGVEVYGPAGVLLPAFSEAALLVFALASARATRTGQPTTVLRLGTLAFAGVAAALNFIHGASDTVQLVNGHPVTVHGSIAHGLVMAVVSVGGVAVHQLIHARPPRPRRSWQQRAAARLARQAERRVYRLRRAAIRTATPMLAADGTVRLVHRPGPLVERRGWVRRWRVTVAHAEGLATGPVIGLADEVEAWLSEGAPGTTPHPSGTEETGGTTAVLTRPEKRSEIPPRVIELAARVQDAIQAGELPANPSRRKVRKYLQVRDETAQMVVALLRGEVR